MCVKTNKKEIFAFGKHIGNEDDFKEYIYTENEMKKKLCKTTDN